MNLAVGVWIWTAVAASTSPARRRLIMEETLVTNSAEAAEPWVFGTCSATGTCGRSFLEERSGDTAFDSHRLPLNRPFALPPSPYCQPKAAPKSPTSDQSAIAPAPKFPA